VADIDDSGPPGGVRLLIDGGLAVITIDRPAARNAIGFATVDELNAAFDEVEASEAAVLVITGGGDRAFVSGGDLKELSAIRTHEQALAMANNIRSTLDRLASMPMPVVAAMNGHALGGGAEVAVAADIRIAADDISIGFNQVTLGIMPAWGGAERLTQLVGRSRAMLAMTSGTRYDAPTAQQFGLLDIVVPRKSFDQEWRALADRMANLAPGAARSIKSVIVAAAPSVHEHTRETATDVFAQLWVAEAHWDAVDAMTQKRKG
jgi:enoyl-CoA hydratase